MAKKILIIGSFLVGIFWLSYATRRALTKADLFNFDSSLKFTTLEKREEVLLVPSPFEEQLLNQGYLDDVEGISAKVALTPKDLPKIYEKIRERKFRENSELDFFRHLSVALNSGITPYYGDSQIAKDWQKSVQSDDPSKLILAKHLETKVTCDEIRVELSFRVAQYRFLNQQASPRLLAYLIKCFPGLVGPQILSYLSLLKAENSKALETQVESIRSLFHSKDVGRYTRLLAEDVYRAAYVRLSKPGSKPEKKDSI